jgi:hypothetical protein
VLEVGAFAGEPAKLRRPSDAPIEQKRQARRARPIKIPDSEGKILFIIRVLSSLRIEIRVRNGRIRRIENAQL